MKIKFMIFALLTFVTTAVLATPKPSMCPSTQSIATISSFEKLTYGPHMSGWTAYTHGNFNTQNTWEFAVTHIIAVEEDDAIREAKTALATMVFVMGPVSLDHKTWQCWYRATENRIYGIASVYS